MTGVTDLPSLEVNRIERTRVEKVLQKGLEGVMG